MSYLNLPGGIADFSKAVISFWFRVPQDSFDKLMTRADFPARLAGVMPLMTFGRLFEGNQLEYTSSQDASYTSTFWQYNGPGAGGTGWVRQTEDPIPISYSSGPAISVGEPTHVDPCYVGVVYEQPNEEGASGTAYLRVHLQTEDKGAASWLGALSHMSIGDKNWGLRTGQVEEVNPMAAWNGHECFTSTTAPGNPSFDTTTYSDISDDIMMIGPDSFRVGSKAMKVEPDQWHHVLLSFDLIAGSASGEHFVFDGTACAPGTLSQTAFQSLGSTSKVWIALDNENYTGNDLKGSLSDYYGNVDALGDNDIISRYTMMAYQSLWGEQHSISWGQQGSIIETIAVGIGTPSYQYPASPLPTSGQPFGIPAAANMVDRILHVEMAEFQMWTGVTLDTGNDDTRRAFIDYPRDKSGDIIRDDSGEKVGLRPVDPKEAEKLMGRKPELLLHGSRKWIEGNNTGLLGADVNDNKIPGGQFIPDGKIVAYKPDPELGK